MHWQLACLASLMPWVLASCAFTQPTANTTTPNKIASELTQAAQTRPPSKARPSAASVPSPEVFESQAAPARQGGLPTSGKPAAEPRFDWVVTDAPMGQVLSSLAAGSTYSILLKSPSADVASAAEPRISLNLKKTTLFEALDALRDVYGYDYSVEKNRILVQPAQLQTRLYHINYILGQRRGVSDLQVVGGASIGRSSGNNSGTSNYASVQASGLSTTVKSDIWSEVEDALRTVLACNIPRSSAGAAALGMAASATNASRADVSHPSDVGAADRMRGVDGCAQGRALTINQMSGTILARGMPTELRMVERLLKSMQLNISRQVIIESKIIDVELNKEAQQGINWSLFQKGLSRFSVGANPNVIGVNQPSAVAGPSGGTVGSAVSLGGLLGAAVAPGSAIAAGAGVAIQAQNFAALINFLESQGRVHVLSSPRIATLNNQKAILKVGSEEPFVTNISGGISTVTGATTVETKPSLVYQPFFSGISLDVTPQIDADDNITMHVHSMVNNVLEKSKIALPDSPSLVPFAVNTMNETDSVVKAKDGQVIVIGGLMTERNADTRNGVPGARELPLLGNLFNWGAQSVIKRELVILLKPTVVRDDSDWAEDIAASGDRLGSAR
jgi:MSHA biogenesis protein MshL